jgi:hypothetical protein
LNFVSEYVGGETSKIIYSTVYTCGLDSGFRKKIALVLGDLEIDSWKRRKHVLNIQY